MDGKKILFHINSLGKGGAERVVSVLSGFFHADGYEVVIYTLWRAKEEYELPGGVRRVNLEDSWQDREPGRLQKALKRLTGLRRMIKKEKPDLVISFCNKANFRSCYALTGMKIPLLTSVRNDPKVDYLPYKTAMAIMQKKASGCVFQTPDAMACFSEAFQKKSKVIWNPIDAKYLSERQTEKVQTRERNVVTVGRLSAQKNQLLLLKAFGQIESRFPGLVLRIYGEESEAGMKATLQSFVTENRLESKVSFMGQSSHLEEEIRDAALFVLPSDYEGMPNALIEAMALGLPCISTDCPCGGPRELIEQGVSGELVPVGDVAALANIMEKILSDDAYAAELGENAKHIAEKVSPHKIYEEWKAYADELMNK